MVMSAAGPRTKNDHDVEDQQQFTQAASKTLIPKQQLQYLPKRWKIFNIRRFVSPPPQRLTVSEIIIKRTSTKAINVMLAYLWFYSITQR
jgi:hypothetical protein